MPDPGALARHGCLGAGRRAWGSILAVGTNAACANARTALRDPRTTHPPCGAPGLRFCFGISSFHLSREIARFMTPFYIVLMMSYLPAGTKRWPVRQARLRNLPQTR